MGDCDKGFIVEIAGTDHPDLSTTGRNNVCLEIYSAMDGSLLPWTAIRKEGEGKSPRTYYIMDLDAHATEKKYYLSLLLPDGTMRAVWPPMPNPEKPGGSGEQKTAMAEPSWLRPTGCRDMDLEFQDIVFIPFRPMTMMPVMGDAAFENCESFNTVRTIYINEAWFKNLRCLRAGYMYIFHQGKLWREMQVGIDGALREVPLFTEEANGGGIQRHHCDGWGKDVRAANVLPRYEEVWIPARLERRKVVAGDYSIAFSQHQWEWSYIEWLQEYWGTGGQDRFQSLQELWDVYTSTQKNDSTALERFGSISHKYNVAQRAPLQNDAFFNHTTVTNPEMWTYHSSPFGLREQKPVCTTDAELWTVFTGNSAEHKENTTPNPLQPVHGGLSSAHNRGLFVVEDPLYAAAFYATKANSALAILDSLNKNISDDEVIGPVNHVRFLEKYAYQTESIAYIISLFLSEKLRKKQPEPPTKAAHHLYTTLGKSLNKEYIATTARLLLRAILRTYIYAAQEQLALLIAPSRGLYAVPGLPGRHVERHYGPLLNASLRDLFMRDSMDNYLEGFAWMHSVVDGMGRSALESDLLDPKLSILHDTDVDACARWTAKKLDRLGSLNWLDEAYTTRIGPTALASWHTFFPGDKEKKVPGLLHMLCPDPEEINIKQELKNLPEFQDYGFFRVAEVQKALTDQCAPRLAGLASRLYQCQLDQLLSPTETALTEESLANAMGHAANLMRLAANMPFIVMVDADELEHRRLLPLILGDDKKVDASSVKPLRIKSTDRLYRHLDEDTSIALYQGKRKGNVPIFLAAEVVKIKLEKVWCSTAASIGKKVPVGDSGGAKIAITGATTWVDFLKLEVSCRNVQSLIHAMASRDMTSSDYYAHAIKLAEQFGRIVEYYCTVTVSLGEIYFFYSSGSMAGAFITGAHPALESFRRVARIAGVLATAIGLLSVEVKARNAWRQGDYLSSLLYCLSPFAVTGSTMIGSAVGPVGGIAGMLMGSEIAKTMEEWAFRWQKYPRIANPLSTSHYGVNAAKPKSGFECRDVIGALYSPIVLFVDITTDKEGQYTTSAWEPSEEFPLDLKEKACNFALTLWKDRQEIQKNFHGFWPEDSTSSQIAIIVWSLCASPAVAGQFKPTQTALHKIIYQDSGPMIAVLQPKTHEYKVNGCIYYKNEKLMPIEETSYWGLIKDSRPSTFYKSR